MSASSVTRSPRLRCSGRADLGLATTYPPSRAAALGSAGCRRLRLSAIGRQFLSMTLMVLAWPIRAATPPPAAGVDQVVELSPFMVTANADIGYIGAQSTLGSRLKQEVKDIASQIEILTPELLQDFGITDVQDAFRYTVNVENPTEYLNPINSADAYFGGQTVGRVRGISTSPFSTTRNLFSSITAADSFNFSRIEVASGAQSMLYSLGQPAGLADVSLNVAEMRDFGSVSFRAGSEGDTRSVVDLNKVLVPGKLEAIRKPL